MACTDAFVHGTMGLSSIFNDLKLMSCCKGIYALHITHATVKMYGHNGDGALCEVITQIVCVQKIII